MKKLFLIPSLLFGMSAFPQALSTEKAIELPSINVCKTSEAMKWLYDNNANSKKEKEDFEIFTEQFAKKITAQKTSTAICYIIPVVFHVYGTVQSGMAVNNALIINALSKVNDDFQGLNIDYSTVHTNFLGIRSTMPDLNFALAKLDPNGNVTNGIVYHPVTAGYGNSSGYDAAIAADAWDNYKYMNVYIMNDLYNNSVYNNSGIAWYPNTFMSNNNTARVVYNGAYVGANTNPEFASVLSHEFGHWLNLIHTFDGGCVPPNDYVNDTPPCDYSGASYTCHPSPTANYPLNCNNNLINAENYMDYSGAGGCYKMFTQGQTARMYAALLHPARQPLWQISNLIATGVSQLCLTTGAVAFAGEKEQILISPNPANSILNISAEGIANGNYNFVLKNTIGQNILEDNSKTENNSFQKTFSISELPNGIYFLTIETEKTRIVKKIIKQD